MISSGLFVLPGLAYARTGPAVIVSYCLAGLLAATGLVSTAELATAMPKAGSDYFFITRAMGPGVGTVAGLFNWVSFSLKAAFALVGMGACIRLFLPIDVRVTGLLLGGAFVALNLAGVREAARVQAWLVAGMIGLMLLYALWGLPAVDVQRYTPFAPQGAVAVFATAGFVFVSYGGLLKVASVAEEVRNPGRTIPAGMILSLLVTGGFYAVLIHVTVGVLPGEQLRGGDRFRHVVHGASVQGGQFIVHLDARREKEDRDLRVFLVGTKLPADLEPVGPHGDRDVEDHEAGIDRGHLLHEALAVREAQDLVVLLEHGLDHELKISVVLDQENPRSFIPGLRHSNLPI